jgi:HAD superfamily hydrolase (TIGR01490 family)
MHSNKELIVIDFDETLYKNDSLIEFCKFVFKKKPLQSWAVLVQVYASILHLFKLIDTKRYKELFLYFLYGINEQEVEKLAKEFWENTDIEHFHTKITALFNRKECRIICISASPEMFLKPIADVYQFELIGTLLSYHHPKYLIQGENCKGVEKVKRLKKYLNTEELSISESYSDSLSDKPLFEHSKNGYIINASGDLQPFIS